MVKKSRKCVSYINFVRKVAISRYLFLLHYFNLQLNYSQIAFKKSTKIGREAVNFNSERNIFY